MRADRLIAILLYLQEHGKTRAGRLAREMEVSVRTIYRDMDALSTAGIPVYFERGPGGGCALLEGYRTRLTGLTQREVRAVFMLDIPAALDQLGVSPDLRSALQKLAAALPPEQRPHRAGVRGRIHLDWSEDSGAENTAPFAPSDCLAVLHQAVWEDRRLQIEYSEPVGPLGRARFTCRLDPLGLVHSRGAWYLVGQAAGRCRAFSVEHILDAAPQADTFTRPPDFDLAAFWQDWRRSERAARPGLAVRLRLAPDLYARLALGPDLRSGPPAPDPDGWVRATLIFADFVAARARVLSFGRAAEVLEPVPLRLSVIDFARQITDFYASLSH